MMAMRIATKPYGLMASLVNAWIFVVFRIFLCIYVLWMRISTWFLNRILSFILVWWFGLNDVAITIGEFGFLSIKGVKIRWSLNDPGLTIEEVGLKKIEWNFEKISDITILFDIKKIQRELFTHSKETITDIYTSCTLHWKMHSPGDLLSSDLLNSSDAIPPSFTLLRATDVQIGSHLDIERGGSYVALLEASVIDGLLIPSSKVKSLYIKARDVTYCCGPYNPGLHQAKQEKILEMPLLDFLSTFYVDGPSRITICYQGMEIFICPTKVNFSLIFVNHLLSQLAIPDTQSDSPVSKAIKFNMEKSLELSIKADSLKATVSLQDGEEVINLIASFSACIHKRNTKSQYTASVGIQAFVPSRQQTKDPCVIVGNELISAPWECTFAGSNWEGHSTVTRISSDQHFSLILRPECIPVFEETREDYMCLLDLTQVNDFLTQLKKRLHRQSRTPKEIFVSCQGIRLALEMNVYEEVLNASLEDIKAEFNRDQHHVTMELKVKELEIEDCTNKIIAFQQQPPGETTSRSFLRFSLMQDSNSEEERIAVKRLHTELTDSIVNIQETLLLKLLQFAGITDKSQLWGEKKAEEPQDSSDNLPAFLTSSRYYFEKLQVDPFQVVITCSPAGKLADELLCLKTTLEIPAGFPPVMENANVQFGEFLRTGISYKTLLSLGRDARRHYLKEIGRQSTSLLGSLHLLGNLSSLQDEIAGGLADLRETGDYMGFVRHVRGGLAESYNKFADSWSVTIAQSTSRTENGPSVWDTTDTSEISPAMRTMRGVVGSLTSFILSPSRDTSQGKLQSSNSSATSPPDSTSGQLASRRLLACASEDHDSSGSEESSLSGVQAAEGWEMVSRDLHRKRIGQEFLQRLQVSLYGEENKDEKFVSCLKLRHVNPEDKLNALITSENVYFMRVGSPTADHVVLTIKLVNLYKARHRDQDGEHYLELLMRISGGKRLPLPSPNPADSPLVRCGTVKRAQKAAKKINDAKKQNEEDNSR